MSPFFLRREADNPPGLGLTRQENAEPLLLRPFGGTLSSAPYAGVCGKLGSNVELSVVQGGHR